MVVGPFRSRAWQSRDDTRTMQALVAARLERDWPSVRIHPGDLDWWAVQAHGRRPDMTERVRLWLGPDDELEAFGWYSPPMDLDFLVAPREPRLVSGLVAEIVDWAEVQLESLADEPTDRLRVWVAVSDGTAMGALEALGFGLERRPGFAYFTGDLALAGAWPGPSLPAGWSIRTLASEADVEARVICGRAAFPGSTMTAERYQTVRAAWIYRADLDLQIVRPHNEVAAFALGWLDPGSGIVELEPVGVDPAWHRHGLGGEICRAVLRSARVLGARRAMIAAERSNDAAVGLYASLGLAITTEIVALTRPTTRPQAAVDG